MTDRIAALETRIAKLHERVAAVELQLAKQRAVNEALLLCSDAFVGGREELLAALKRAE